jgi:hypothetical protein
MKIYKNIIKLSSMMEFFRKKKNDKITNIIITINDDMAQTAYKQNNKCNYNLLQYIFNISYKFFVSCILLWPIILVAVYAIKFKDSNYFTSNIYLFLPIIQYIMGILYYKTNHISNSIKRNIEHMKYILASYILSLIISVCIFISIIVLMACKANLSIFRELSSSTDRTGFIVVVIFTGLYAFYSYLIILINLTTFGSIFIMHSMEISKYYDKLDKFIDINSEELSLESITKEHAETKSYYSLSVDKLNNMFSSITIIGFIGAYYVLINHNTKYASIYNYMLLATFAIIELLYVYSINKVKGAVSNITKLMSSEKIISRYLSTVVFKDIIVDNSTDSDQQNSKSSFPIDGKKIDHIIDISTRVSIRVNETLKSLTWHTLQRKLSEPWDCFNICGFDIDDATILNKLITVIVGTLMLFNIKTAFDF